MMQSLAVFISAINFGQAARSRSNLSISLLAICHFVAPPLERHRQLDAIRRINNRGTEIFEQLLLLFLLEAYLFRYFLLFHSVFKVP
jgi:hypothetical protein